MTKTAPNVHPDHLYNKSETAKMLGISRVTLRKYTRLNRIKPIFQTLTGKELYTGEEILAAWHSQLGMQYSDSELPMIGKGFKQLDNIKSQSFGSHIGSYKMRAK